MKPVDDLEIKELRIELIDLVSLHIGASKEYIPYLSLYDSELEALVELPEAERKRALVEIAKKIISSHKRDKSGGRKDGRIT